MKFSLWRTKLLGALVHMSGLTSEAGKVTLQPQDGERVLTSAGNILGRNHIPGFFPTTSLSSSPIPVAVRAGWLSGGANSLVWVQTGCIWH